MLFKILTRNVMYINLRLFTVLRNEYDKSAYVYEIYDLKLNATRPLPENGVQDWNVKQACRY